MRRHRFATFQAAPLSGPASGFIAAIILAAGQTSGMKSDLAQFRKHDTN